MGARVEIQGLDAAIKGIKDIGTKFQSDLSKAIVDFGEAVVKDARDNAPADEGLLRTSIGSEPNGLELSIVATANYAAYLEFGTRKFAAKYVATLPPDWQAYAATFKGGGGGSLDDFIQSIMAWVQRKGIGATKTKSGNNSTSAASQDNQQQAAYAIALNILQNGIRPQPFLYPAINRNKGKLEDDIKKLVNG